MPPVNNGHTNGQRRYDMTLMNDPIALNMMREYIANQSTTLVRSDLLNKFQDPRRSIEDECGWPEPGSTILDAQGYQDLFDRHAIANRVVGLMPSECWAVHPTIYEDEDPEVVTPFEEALDDLSNSLRGESWYQDSEGSPIWEYLHRLDEQCGIGTFGILLFGFDDGKLLQEPIDGMPMDGYQKDITGVSGLGTKDAKGQSNKGDLSKDIYGGSPANQPIAQPLSSTMGTDAQYFGTQFTPSSYHGGDPTRPMSPGNDSANPSASKENQGNDSKPSKNMKLLFLRVFPAYLVQVVQYEADIRSPRFGLPIMYLITINDPRQPHTGVGLPMATVRVHWHRVLHVADNLTTSEIFGVPRMRPVLNNLMDLKKLYGGSAEMYWKGAMMGLSIETHPQLGGDVITDDNQIRDMMENYFNGLQRYIGLKGQSAKPLAPQVVDPTPQIAGQIQAICIQMKCPQRVFMGSERGELASSQDDASWNDRVSARLKNFVTPRIIIPFFDRLIQVGVLPEPKNPKSIELDSPKTKAASGSLPPAAKPNPTGEPPGPLAKKPPMPGKAGKPSFPPAPSANRYIYNADDMLEEDEENIAPDNSPKSGNIARANGNGTSTAKAKGGYSIEWPDLDATTKMDKATIALTKTQALAAYISGNCESIVPPPQYLTSFMEMDDLEVIEMLEDAQAAEEEKQQEAEDLASQHGLVPEVPGFKEPTPPPLPPTANPVKMGAGQSLVHPETGKTIAKTPFPPKSAKPPTKNIASKICPRCEGDGKAHGADRPFEWNGPGSYPGPCPVCRGVGRVLSDNSFCPTGVGGGIDPSCSSSTPSMPNGHNDWAKMAKTITDKQAKSIADNLLNHVNEASFTKQVNYIASQLAKEVTPGLARRTDLLRARAALETYQSDKANEAGQSRKGVLSKAGLEHGASSGHFVSKDDEKEAWIKAWSIGQGKSVANVFCATGIGGGTDPTCSPGGSTSSGSIAIKAEAKTPPPPGKEYSPNVEKAGKDGITTSARVGVPAMTVPPPPPIGKIPNLTPHEREVEKSFIDKYEANPDKVAGDYRKIIEATTKPGEPPTFGTDDAKVLTDVWSHPDQSVRSENRATLNVALHQTANAIAKRAFVSELDKLSPGDNILVTVGGCGAGKGYALKNVPKALEMKQASKAVWDSAGDQNATENPWVQKEAEKRGLNVNYVYIHADPQKQWADPERGVVKRAADPSDGRMVDAKVFADSYAIGAQNHQAFYEKNKDNPHAKFVFLANQGKPTELSGIPKEALHIDRHELAKFANDAVKKSDAPPHVKRGATMGERIWATGS